MRKFIILSFFGALCFLQVKAQDVSLKGGLGYAMQSEKLGVLLGARVGLTPKIDLAGGFGLFFPDTYNNGNGTKVKSNIWMFDVDGHYNFTPGGAVKLYPLVGINFTTGKVKVNDTKTTNTEVGLNMGGGLAYSFTSKIDGFFEIKYILGNADQGMLGFGVFYKL
ncbi:MAG: outer membrane beta-barrel protein [Imperialibacter sp.]|uniref:outer membrane beta-barrel protein n=1 Tax=Imperialibacter sp. TaxID=2038411 RepID=UPI0032ECCADA